MPLPVEMPLSKHFGPDRLMEIEKYVDERLQALVMSLSDLRERKITQWRRIYQGMPLEKTKSFPWQNASNVVIQLVGSFSDQMLAKWLMSIFGIDPLWQVNINGIWEREERAEEKRAAIQDWLIFSGMEPGYLNLLPKYQAWGSTVIRYGLGAMKIMPERVVEKVAAYSDSNGRVMFSDFVKHDGPVAMPLLFEDFLIPLTVAEIERSPFTAQRVRMSKFELEALRYDPTYDKEAIETVLKTPDREGPERTEQDQIMDQGVQGGDTGGPAAKVWDIYECWFPYIVAGRRFSIIYTYHLGTKKTIKRVFNWLPENSLPFVKSVLGYDGERSHGFGFCEMLKDYQEEVSAIHNRRGDASTLSNTNIMRVGGGTQLGEQFSIYPNAIFPGETGSIEIIPLGRTANETIKDEQMTLNLATDRAGIGPSSSGAGAGTVNKKNAYSAMGTYAVMQEGDTRANLSKTGFKHAHYTLGRLKILFDANFGIPERDIAAFGKQGKSLKLALENIRKKRLVLPIRAATGSINKEVEKQNEMLLLNNHRAHWQMQAQLLQAIQSPMMSPMQKDYIWQTFQAANMLMTKIDKDFGFEDPTSLLPAPGGAEEQAQMAHKAAQMETVQMVVQQMMQQPGGLKALPGMPQEQQPGGEPPQQGQQQPPEQPPQGQVQ
jgi:hypothetical protein